MEGIDFLPFTSEIIWWTCALIALLIASALLSGSETAFFSLVPSQRSELDEENSKNAKTVLKLLNNSEKLLSSVLIGNNLVNIAVVLVANSLLNCIVSFGSQVMAEFVIKTVLLTFFLLLFGEMLPKIAATYNPKSFAKRMAQPIEALCWLLNPISWLLVKMGGLITAKINPPGVSIDELQEAIEITQTESAEDKRMLKGIVNFSSTEVVEICIPRIDVVALDCETPFKQVLQTVVKSGFSRIPVYQDDFDHVIGILYIKDLLPHIQHNDQFNWIELLRKPYFVPEHKKINDLLAEFQSRKIHMAIVVDEYGGTLGVATLEDILEEIVGEITDESDVQGDFFQRIDANTYIFEGRTHLGDFLRVLNMPQTMLDNVKGDADTLAGLMLEIKGEFFKPNDSVAVEEITLSAQQIEGYRIMKIKVKLPQQQQA